MASHNGFLFSYCVFKKKIQHSFVVFATDVFFLNMCSCLYKEPFKLLFNLINAQNNSLEHVSWYNEYCWVTFFFYNLFTFSFNPSISRLIPFISSLNPSISRLNYPYSSSVSPFTFSFNPSNFRSNPFIFSFHPFTFNFNPS